MNIKHLATSLLVAVAVAAAVPALAQSSKPCKPVIPDLSGLDKLSRLGDLAELRALDQLKDLQQLKDLPQLKNLSALSSLASLEALRALDELGQQMPPRPPRPPRAPRPEGMRERGPQRSEHFSKTFRVGRNGSLDLSNISGDIVVKAGGGDDIVIEANKHTPDGPDAQEQLNAVTITATERSGRVEVKTEYPQRGHNIHTSVDFNVTVPATAAVYVHSISGDVKVDAVKGTLRANTVSGDVSVDDADQLDEAKTISGSVVVTRAAGGEVRIGSVSSDVTVRGLRARALEATSVSGEVKLADVSADRLRTSSISGDIEYTGAFAPRGRYEFKSHSGDVRVTVTSNTGFELDASSFSGNIHCDLPMNATRAGEGRVRHDLHGTIGDGSALVSASSFSGTITIKK